MIDEVAQIAACRTMLSGLGMFKDQEISDHTAVAAAALVLVTKCDVTNPSVQEKYKELEALGQKLAA